MCACVCLCVLICVFMYICACVCTCIYINRVVPICAIYFQGMALCQSHKEITCAHTYKCQCKARNAPSFFLLFFLRKRSSGHCSWSQSQLNTQDAVKVRLPLSPIQNKAQDHGNCVVSLQSDFQTFVLLSLEGSNEFYMASILQPRENSKLG
jgi:hypothetical protein